MQDTELRHALVFAIAHEIGNHLAGIRLEAHLLDEDLGVSGLARSSVAIDAGASQAGALLGLLRPLLAPTARRSLGGTSGTCLATLEGVRRQLEEEGLAGHRVELEIRSEDAGRAPAFEGLHALLVLLVGLPETLATGLGPISLHIDRADGEIVIGCGLPGRALAYARATGAATVDPRTLRGRELAVAVARVLVGDAGGAVAVDEEAGRSRIAMRLPR
jgi:hypothetical protein